MKKLLLLLLMGSSICKAQIAEDIFDVFSDGSIYKIYSMIDDFDLSQTVKNLEYEPTNPYNFTVCPSLYKVITLNPLLGSSPQSLNTHVLSV